MAKSSMFQKVQNIDTLISKNVDYFFCDMMKKSLQLFVVFDKKDQAYLGVLTELDERDRECLRYTNPEKTYFCIQFYAYDMFLDTISETHFKSRLHFSVFLKNTQKIELEMIQTRKQYAGRGIGEAMLQTLDFVTISKFASKIKGTMRPFDYCDGEHEKITKFYNRCGYHIRGKKEDQLQRNLNKAKTVQSKRQAINIPATHYDYTLIIPKQHLMHTNFSQRQEF